MQGVDLLDCIRRAEAVAPQMLGALESELKKYAEQIASRATTLSRTGRAAPAQDATTGPQRPPLSIAGALPSSGGEAAQPLPRPTAADVAAGVPSADATSPISSAVGQAERQEGGSPPDAGGVLGGDGHVQIPSAQSCPDGSLSAPSSAGPTSSKKRKRKKNQG